MASTAPPAAAIGFEASRTDSNLCRLLLLLAAIGLGEALQIQTGFYHPRALLFVALSFVACLAASLLHRVASVNEKLPEWSLSAAVLAGLALQFQRLLVSPQGMYQRLTAEVTADQFRSGILAAAVLSFLLVLGQPKVRRVALPMLLIVHFALGAWMIRSSPNPWIDTFVMHQGGIPAFLHGTNPYTMDFPYLYGGPDTNIPGLVSHGRTLTGFPYPPLSLFLSIPGYVLGGDYRYALLAAMTLFGALIAYSSRDTLSAGIAALFLFTPRTFFVLEQGWTEPFLLLLFGALVWSCLRRPKLIPYLFGLLLFVKQYTPLAAPAALLLKRPGTSWTRFAIEALKVVAIGLAIMLPFLLISPGALYESTIGMQSYLPPRDFELSFKTGLYKLLLHPPPPLAFTLVGLAAVLISFFAVRRTAMGFMIALSMTFFSFFAFRQAFCNYYYLVIGLMLLGAAVGDSAPAEIAKIMLEGERDV